MNLELKLKKLSQYLGKFPRAQRFAIIDVWTRGERQLPAPILSQKDPERLIIQLPDKIVLTENCYPGMLMAGYLVHSYCVPPKNTLKRGLDFWLGEQFPSYTFTDFGIEPLDSNYCPLFIQAHALPIEERKEMGEGYQIIRHAMRVYHLFGRLPEFFETLGFQVERRINP